MQLLALEKYRRPGRDWDSTIREWIDSGEAQRFNQDYANRDDDIDEEVQLKGLTHITKSRLHQLLQDE
jgi:hypothetical protein